MMRVERFPASRVRIDVPIYYPGPDEFIALVTRMRIAGAWDSQNDWLVSRKDYGQFINDCVGYDIYVNGAGKRVLSGWEVSRALRSRGFISFRGGVTNPFHTILEGEVV